MLDVRFIRENPDLVKKAAAAKNERRADVDRIVALDDRRRALQTEIDQANTRVNALSKEIAAAKRADPKADVSSKQAESKAVGDAIRASQEQMKAVEEEQRALLQWIPNLPHDSVPAGEDARANAVVKTWPQGFAPAKAGKPHWDVGKALDILDEERAAKLSGSNFLLLKGAGAHLERALISFMLDLHVRKHKYVEIWPPFLVNRPSMVGTGQIPKLEDDMYRLRDDELWLIPTAEVPVTNLHRDEILPHGQLPVYYTSYTACFRREAGAYSKDTRGMQRIHQFDKVEMVKLVHPDRSWEELESLTRDAEEVLELLGLLYRRVLLSTGDMSFASAKTYDLEAWAPGLDKWLEVS
ncbi:MAG TPA: serine--tRNA ligase, partial [Planctomycetota bacterium]|nr:serine--tRNA ligase [Planctomycetota bacterium]